MFGKTRSSRLWISSRQTAHRRHFAASGGFALPAENINHHNGNHKNKRSQRHPPASSGFRFSFMFFHAFIIEGLPVPVFHQQGGPVQTAGFRPIHSLQAKGTADIRCPFCAGVLEIRTCVYTCASAAGSCPDPRHDIMQLFRQNDPAASVRLLPTTVRGFPGRLCPVPGKRDLCLQDWPDLQWPSWAY